MPCVVVTINVPKFVEVKIGESILRQASWGVEHSDQPIGTKGINDAHGGKKEAFVANDTSMLVGVRHKCFFH